MQKIITYDVGSLPSTSFEMSFKEIKNNVELHDKFQASVVSGLIDKLRVGIDIPNYPQYRNMIDMFIEMIGGIEKVGSRYIMFDKLMMRETEIPEVRIIRERIKDIYDIIGERVKIKICLTGPYTLSSVFMNRSPELIKSLSDIIARITAENIFKVRYGEIGLITLDEPVFGFLDDSLIEYKSEGREALLNGWEKIFRVALSHDVSTSIHLHNTSDPLFWDVDSLQIIESHVNDHIYYSSQTKSLLEEKDKFVKASICITDFNSLIINSLRAKYREVDIPSMLANVWRDIRRGFINPVTYLETPEIMEKRLRKIIQNLGIERVRYAGPECGLKGFPNYETAMEYLRRVVIAVDNVNKSQV